MISYFLFLFRTVVSVKCRALVMSGGGSWGVYESGVFDALVSLLPAEEVAYNVVIGISAGSINSMGIAQFEQGDQKTANTFLKSLYAGISASDVYQEWPGGPLEGLIYKPGLVNNAPLHGYFQKTFTGSIKRNITIGTTDMDKVLFTHYNESYGLYNMQEATVCSASIPAFFPYATFMGTHYMDGGVMYSIDIFEGVKRCLDVVDEEDIIIDMTSTHKFNITNDNSTLDSVDVFWRTRSIGAYDHGMRYLYYAMIAYPKVNFRYFVMPSVHLPGIPLDFSQSTLQIIQKQGYSDTENCVNNNITAIDILRNYYGDSVMKKLDK